MRRRSASRALALLFALLVAGALAGCGSATPGSPSTGASAARSSSPEPSMEAQSQAISLSSVEHQITRLYQDHPAVARFTIQDVSYTSRSRARVLQTCSGDGRQEPSEAVESSRVLACAPLIYFFFDYGRRAGVGLASALADAIYSYASESIRGPQNTQSMLGSILRSWGVPVSGSRAAPAGGESSPAAAALIDSVRRAILAQRGARVTITGFQDDAARPVARISALIGTDSGAETIRQPGALASIRVTPDSAYLSGNRAGLTTLLGLPSARTRDADGRWLRLSRTSAEYRDLATENTIAALPASILPTASRHGHRDPRSPRQPTRADPALERGGRC